MDREKVIKDLEFCVNGHFKVELSLATKILALLKTWEAKPMIENERGWNCPSCGMKLIGKTASGYPCDLIDLPINFCPRCGQEVKCDA